MMAEPLTGIILAGGESSRMGVDKGLIPYRGKPFVQHIIEALQPWVGEIIIASGRSEYDRFQLRRVSDLIEDAGPLAGIYTGLFYTKTRGNLILSCDIPLINASVLAQLVAHRAEPFQVIQMQHQNETMPLIALYKKGCMRTCLKLIESGERRVRVWVDQLRSKAISASDATARYMVNINTPSELKKIESWM